MTRRTIQSCCLRKTDSVARLGGDEFTLILSGLNGIAGASVVARRLVKAISDPVQIKEHTIYVSVSIGIRISRRWQ